MEQTDKVFVGGMHAFAPRLTAPAFVRARISIKPEQFAAFVAANKKHLKDGYFCIDVKVSRDGKWYCELDTFRKEDGARALPAREREEAVEPEAVTAEPLDEEIKPEDIPF